MAAKDQKDIKKSIATMPSQTTRILLITVASDQNFRRKTDPTSASTALQVINLHFANAPPQLETTDIETGNIHKEVQQVQRKSVKTLQVPHPAHHFD